MTPQNFLKLIEKQQPELLKLVRDDLPRIVGTKAMQHFRENFARGGFVDRDLEPWEVTWRQKTLSGADGQRGPLLSRTNTLRNRINFRASAGRATIYNNLIYAAIHNEGGNIITIKNASVFFQKIESHPLLQPHSPQGSGVGGKDGVGGTRFDAAAASRAVGCVDTCGRNGCARAFRKMKSYG